MGFFAKSSLISEAPADTVPKCAACGLYRTCKSPKMPVYGKGKKGILIFGEAPGQNEDDRGIPFCGKAGRFLREVLRENDIDIERDCWTTNALICRPPENAKPTEKQIGWCRPNLTNVLNELHPTVALCLGEVPTRSMLIGAWNDKFGTISRWAGWRIPLQGTWICPTFHPSYCLRSENARNPVPSLLFRKHVSSAIRLNGKRPPIVALNPNLIMILWDSCDVTASLFGMRKRAEKNGEALAIDYETDRLKPDDPNSRILSCAVSNGTRTIAFPWSPAVEVQMGVLWRSHVGKIASNLKFEHRWTVAKLLVEPRNWIGDTMLRAHWEDNRPGITGLKFQAFVRLGVRTYDSAVKPFMKIDKKTGSNSLDKIEKEVLLKYNGLDALIEWHLWKEQTS